MSATTGNDLLIGTTGDDFIDLLAGDDSYSGLDDNDSILGNTGNDTLSGGNDADSILGGDGNDRIFGGTGSDSIDAGAGTSDIISFNHTSAQAVSATISAIGGSAGSNYAEVRTASQGNDTIINFESIDGSFENDGFTINSAATDNALLFVFGSIGADSIAVNVASNAVMANYNTITGSTNFTRGVIVDLNAGTADDGRGGIDSLIGVRGVNGSSFGDTILGSVFNDRFRENGGSDSINGRDGFDMLDYSGNSASQSVSVNLAAERASDGRGGTDTVISMEYVRSGSGNDTLIGNAADNELRGGSGADILDGGASGFDIADYANNSSAQAISVNLTTGRASDGFGFNDTLVSIEYIRGGSGNDTMIGSAANERFRGNAGDDTIDGGGGTEDILDLSQTTQSVSANLVTGLANDGLGGTDGFTGIEVVYSGTASDTLLGSDRNEIFDGGMGGDLIDGGLGADRVRYWNVSGRNSAITQGVSVDLAAQRATDGWGGQDTLIGIERVTATNFADTLLGNNVSNRFNGRAGSDSIDGGLSIDWLEYLDEDATSGITVNLTTGTASDGRGGTDVFTSIENVSGQGFADHLTGIAQLGRSTSGLRGGGGSDTLVGIVNEFVVADYTDQTMGLSVNLASGSVNDGLGGIDQLVNIRGAIMLGNYADTIIGTAGNDWLSPGGGNDTISGGDGLDIISYDGNPTSGVSVNLATGRASDGDGGTDSLNGVEGVWVSYSNDTLIGDGQGNLIGLGAGADSADAAGGQDTISYSLGFSPNTSVYVFNEAQNQLSFTGVIIDLAAGRATDYGGAADTILNFEAAIGSTMHDSILGSNGNDVLDGAEGNDTLNGFGGDDRMFGGQGNDLLIAGLGTVNLDGGAGDDVILVGNVTLTEIHALFGP
jgi:Ca2+-binding RTX toxin-like protein